MGGALGAALLLKVTLRKRWVTQDLDSRALWVTALGRRELKRSAGPGRAAKSLKARLSVGKCNIYLFSGEHL